MTDQLELIPLRHRSLQPNRLKKYGHVNPERIYAAEWIALNKRSLSTGMTYLEAILTADNRPTSRVVTQRDAAVAASVIQWLGTNCGMAFVQACERKIEAAHRFHAETEKLKRKLAHRRWARVNFALQRAAEMEKLAPRRRFFEDDDNFGYFGY